MKGVVLEDITKAELISAIQEAAIENSMVLITGTEAADLLKCTKQYIWKLKMAGKLTDYSLTNSQRKYSAREVVEMRRKKFGIE